MFVESFHRLLKVVFLEQKQNRRVDKLIHELFRIVKHITFDQLIKLEKGTSLGAPQPQGPWPSKSCSSTDSPSNYYM